MRAGWPKAKDTMARAVLALSLKAGARDLADDAKVRRGNLNTREYYHLCPQALLENAGSAPERIHCALNCALVTWNTKRHISAKEPIAYLGERTERTALCHDEIRRRVASHLIPYEALSGGPYDPESHLAQADQVREAYENFLSVRAQLMVEPMISLCRGQQWPVLA